MLCHPRLITHQSQPISGRHSKGSRGVISTPLYLRIFRHISHCKTRLRIYLGKVNYRSWMNLAFHMRSNIDSHMYKWRVIFYKMMSNRFFSHFESCQVSKWKIINSTKTIIFKANLVEIYSLNLLEIRRFIILNPHQF